MQNDFWGGDARMHIVHMVHMYAQHREGSSFHNGIKVAILRGSPRDARTCTEEERGVAGWTAGGGRGGGGQESEQMADIAAAPPPPNLLHLPAPSLSPSPSHPPGCSAGYGVGAINKQGGGLHPIHYPPPTFTQVCVCVSQRTTPSRCRSREAHTHTHTLHRACSQLH